MGLLEHMLEAGVEPTVHTAYAVAKACERGGAFTAAVAALQRFPGGLSAQRSLLDALSARMERRCASGTEDRAAGALSLGAHGRAALTVADAPSALDDTAESIVAALEADPAAAAPVVHALERILDVQLEVLGSYRQA